MKRIRYENSKEEGILQSVRNIHSEKTGAMYIVYLNTNDCTYKIKNIINKKKYCGGDEINNLHVLKRHIKVRLEELGVVFGTEIRNVEKE